MFRICRSKSDAVDNLDDSRPAEEQLMRETLDQAKVSMLIGVGFSIPKLKE
jgi:hypothetical protein